MKHSVWNHAKGVAGQSHVWTLIGLTAVSVAVHGIVLGLPIPQTKPTEALAPPTASGEVGTVMDVAILPDRALDTSVESAPEPEQGVEKTVPSEGVEPSLTTEKTASPPLLDPISPVAEPPLPAVPPVDEAVSDPVSESTSSSESSPDPLTELPPEPGSGDLSEPEPPPPPTLAEQLQDPTAYQYDGRKSLDQLAAATESMNWAVEGQPLPSKVGPLELPYQLADYCLDTPPVIGLLMVVADAEGNFLRGPEVISSTGYRLLDEQAVEQVKNRAYVLPDREAPKAYSVEVKVQYPASCL